MSDREPPPRRGRNVPHPPADPDGIAIAKRSRPEASQRRHWPERDADGAVVPRKQRRQTPGRFDAETTHERGRNVSNGLPRGRRVGANGSWPATDDEPKPPAFCALYDDLLDLELFARPSRDAKPCAVFGQYPRALIPMLLPWLRCERREILHVCSGSLPPGEGIRVDCRLEARPDILADGRALPLRDGSIAAVLLDPPYTKQYARDLYGVPYPRPSHLLREAARVVRPCGRIGFVHYLVPMPPPQLSRGQGSRALDRVRLPDEGRDDLRARPGDRTGPAVRGRAGCGPGSCAGSVRRRSKQSGDPRAGRILQRYRRCPACEPVGVPPRLWRWPGHWSPDGDPTVLPGWPARAALALAHALLRPLVLFCSLPVFGPPSRPQELPAAPGPRRLGNPELEHLGRALQDLRTYGTRRRDLAAATRLLNRSRTAGPTDRLSDHLHDGGDG